MIFFQLVREANKEDSSELEDEMLTDTESVGVKNQIEYTVADVVGFRKWRNYPP